MPSFGSWSVLILCGAIGVVCLVWAARWHQPGHRQQIPEIVGETELLAPEEQTALQGSPTCSVPIMPELPRTYSNVATIIGIARHYPSVSASSHEGALLAFGLAVAGVGRTSVEFGVPTMARGYRQYIQAIHHVLAFTSVSPRVLTRDASRNVLKRIQRSRQSKALLGVMALFVDMLEEAHHSFEQNCPNPGELVPPHLFDRLRWCAYVTHAQVSSAEATMLARQVLVLSSSAAWADHLPDAVIRLIQKTRAYIASQDWSQAQLANELSRSAEFIRLCIMHAELIASCVERSGMASKSTILDRLIQARAFLR